MSGLTNPITFRCRCPLWIKSSDEWDCPCNSAIGYTDQSGEIHVRGSSAINSVMYNAECHRCGRFAPEPAGSVSSIDTKNGKLAVGDLAVITDAKHDKWPAHIYCSVGLRIKIVYIVSNGEESFVYAEREREDKDKLKQRFVVPIVAVRPCSLQQ